MCSAPRTRFAARWTNASPQRDRANRSVLLHFVSWIPDEKRHRESSRSAAPSGRGSLKLLPMRADNEPRPKGAVDADNFSVVSTNAPPATTHNGF